MCSVRFAGAFTLRQRMLNFVQNIQYYMMFEVMEPTWHILEKNLKSVSFSFHPVPALERLYGTQGVWHQVGSRGNGVGQVPGAECRAGPPAAEEQASPLYTRELSG